MIVEENDDIIKSEPISVMEGGANGFEILLVIPFLFFLLSTLKVIIQNN